MNEHKFYNEYVLPVLEEIKEELNKRGVDCYIRGNRLLQNQEKPIKQLLTYYVDDGEYVVSRSLHNLFNNEFNRHGDTTELIFKEFPAPLVEKTIYDLEIGDTYYSIASNGYLLRKDIKTDFDLDIYKTLLADDNVFITQEDCEKRISKNKAIAKIKRRAYELQGDWKPDWENCDEDKIYIRYGHRNKILRIFVIQQIEHTGICFKSREIAWKIINELPNECKLMLEVYDE